MRRCSALLVTPALLLLLPSFGLPQEVTLPLERYDALRLATHPAATPEPKPPAPYALESAGLEIRVDGGSARIAQSLSLSLYDPDWQTIPLSAVGSVTAAQLGPLEGSLRTEKDAPGLALVVRGLGRHRLRLESVVPLTEDATATRTTRTLSFVLPAAAAVNGELWVPQDVGAVVFQRGGLARGSSGGRWSFAGAPGAALVVQLLGRTRAVERSRLPLKFEADVTTLATVGRTRTRVKALVTTRVLQGQLERLRLALPQGFELLNVSAGDAGWEVEQGALVVTPAAPVESMVPITVDLSAEPGEEPKTPLLVPRGSARTRFWSGMQVDADGTAEVTEPGSARLLEDAEREQLPASMRGPLTLFLLVRDPARPPQWHVTWAEGSKVLGAQVDRLLVDVAFGEAGRAAYQCWAVVRSSGATHLSLGMPDRFVLATAERDGLPVIPGLEAGGLVVPLAGGDEAQLVHVSGMLSGVILPAEGTLDVLVPSTSAPIGQAEVRATLPGGRTYALASPERSAQLSPLPPPRHAAGASPRPLALAPFPAPAGHVVLEAAWSALSTKPIPLTIRVKPAAKKERWF
jgi:hypothetical protein